MIVLISFPQVQHLTDPPPPDSSNGGGVDLDSILVEDSSAFSTPTGHRQSHHSTTANSSSSPILPDLVHTLIHRLLPSAYQRVCIYSAGIAGDICQGNAAFMKILFSLLLHSSSADCDNCGRFFFVIKEKVCRVSLN